MQYLKNLQINDKILFNNMTDAELLNEIEGVDVLYSGPQSYIVSISFLNAEGKKFVQQIIF